MIASNVPISLDFKREFYIISLYQWKTYKNLYCGFPTSELNARIIEDTIEYAKDIFKLEEVIHIKPTETPIRIKKKLSYGEPFTLPKVTCIAEVNYRELLNNKIVDKISQVNPKNMMEVDTEFLEVGIIWFQENFCMPIEPSVLDELRKIEWKKN